MRLFSFANTILNRWCLAAIGGILLGLAFPKSNWAGFAWIGPGIILFSAAGRPGGEAFRLGYVAGVIQSLFTLRWLLHIPFPAGAVAGWLALSAYLGLYTGLWVWMAWRFFPNKTPHQSAPSLNRDTATWFARTTLTQRAGWALVAAIFWVGNEIITARLLSGFPWLGVGITQSELVPIIQISNISGIYGVSFLVVWFSVSAISATMVLVSQPRPQRTWILDLVLPMGGILLAMLYGFQQMGSYRTPTATAKLGLVQPSIPQTLIWDTTENKSRFQKLIELSELALATKPDLLIWPEAAVPTLMRHDPETANALRDLLGRHKTWAVVGSDDADVGPSNTSKDARYYNSSFAISPSGIIEGIYRKRRLVIFGEYVPLLHWFPFLQHLTPIGENGFSAGDKPVSFFVPSRDGKHRITLSPLICFEDAFPHSVGEYVQADTDFLLNLTNDGWFGESNAQWQHAAHAVFRAVENRVPVVSCANNGLTCWIDPLGRMHEVYWGQSVNIYGAGFKTAQVPILSGEKRVMTFYHEYGDVFGWSCTSLWAAALLLALWQSRRTRQQGKSADSSLFFER
ncbi:MAG: apolipoprotein N-acyltransferase [Verrucomicrobia bacterium]|nr:apolipoprotein N-acyltransferase [Verrucomicrobiota bacterium]